MGELILEGKRYIGRFQAVDQEDRYESENWWKGQGLIEDTKTGDIVRFLFHTISSPFLGELEEGILCFDKRYPYNKKPMITNRPAVIDLQLSDMYERVKAKEKAEIIPEISPKTFVFNELLIRGLVAEEDGQIRIPLHPENDLHYQFGYQ